MTLQTLTQTILNAGATRAKPIPTKQIRFYPTLLALCTMNSCGHYSANWRCPPACPSPSEMRERLAACPSGVLFQVEGLLEDSLDYVGMTATGHAFHKTVRTIKAALDATGADFLLLGAGGCDLCPQCTYPDAPCRHPETLVYPLEGCGINVAEICETAGLPYIGSENTVTFTGLAALPQAAPTLL